MSRSDSSHVPVAVDATLDHLHFQDSETLQFIQTFDDDYCI